MNITPSNSTVALEIILCGNEFDLEYVTNKIGIQPNFKRTKLDKRRNGEPFDYTAWGYVYSAHPSWNIADHFNEMLKMFKGKEKTLVEVAKKCNAEWNLIYVIEIENGDKPSIGFTKPMISFLYEIGAEVEFDYYIYSLYKEENQ